MLLGSARFSPNGRHIIAGTAFSLLYLLSDFQRVIRGTVTSREAMETVNIKDAVMELIWSAHDFRFIVRTVGILLSIILVRGSHISYPRQEVNDIFVVDLNPGHHTDVFDVSTSTLSFTGARFLNILDFSNPYSEASGNVVVQKTTIWFLWDVSLFYEDVQKRLEKQSQTLQFGPQGGTELAGHSDAKGASRR